MRFLKSSVERSNEELESGKRNESEYSYELTYQDDLEKKKEKASSSSTSPYQKER